LIRREALQKALDSLDSECGKRLGLGVADSSLGRELVRGGGANRSAALSTPCVEEAEVCDREHPGAELCVITLETVQIADDLEKYVPGEVLRVGRALTSQVSDHAGTQVLIYVRPRRVGTGPGGL
jgi:hypothetical protein